MVHFAYIGRGRLIRRNWRRAVRAFSLLEIVLVLFIAGILAATLIPSVREIVERARRDAEVRTLDELATAIVGSFDAADLSGENVAALPGTLGPGDVATRFSVDTGGQPAAVSAADWFAKVARRRGIAVQVGVAPGAQPALAQVAFNPVGQPRLLFAGPVEAGRQRFLLVSLTARNEQLVLPAYEAGAAWFDALWNHDWESHVAAPPAYWTGRLPAAQMAAWGSGAGGRTQGWRLCVRRIVLAKFTVGVNNNHPADAAYVSYDNRAPAFTAPANSGASTTPEILGGRLIIVNRGTAWPGVEALRFRLRENATITVQ